MLWTADQGRHRSIRRGPFFLPLGRIKTERRKDSGAFRFYNIYRLPPEYGGKDLRLRLSGNEEDESRGLNRAEDVRAIPPPDPDFLGLFRRRNDAESLNRGIEDSFYWTRAHSVGALAQEADLFGFGLGLNALTSHRHRKRVLPSAALYSSSPKIANRYCFATDSGSPSRPAGADPQAPRCW